MKDDINLLPQREKDYSNSLRSLVIIFSIIGFLTCGGVGLLLYLYNQGMKEKIAQKDQEIQKLSSQVDSQLSAGLDKKADKFQKQTVYMRSILEKHIFASQAMDNMLGLIMPEIRFNNLSMEYPNTKASLDIAGPSYSSIARQIQKIRGSLLVAGVKFSNITFTQASQSKEGEEGELGQAKIGASLEIDLKKEAWGVKESLEPEKGVLLNQAGSK